MAKNDILCASASLREKYQTVRMSRLMVIAKKVQNSAVRSISTVVDTLLCHKDSLRAVWCVEEAQVHPTCYYYMLLQVLPGQHGRYRQHGRVD
jgi:hypothetical protein